MWDIKELGQIFHNLIPKTRLKKKESTQINKPKKRRKKGRKGGCLGQFRERPFKGVDDICKICCLMRIPSHLWARKPFLGLRR